jgi:hypothetical protein
MNTRPQLLLLISVLSLATIMCVQDGGTADESIPLTARLTELSGTVQTLKSTSGELADAQTGTHIELGDQVITHFDSRARLDLSNQTIIRVGPLSSFTLKEIGSEADGFSFFKLDIGTMWIILNGGTVEIETPTGIASVRGSYLFVRVDSNTFETAISCLEGLCTLGNQGGQLTLIAGQTAIIEDQHSPPVSGEMSDADVADWLENNPEATQVIVPLTATSASRSTPIFATATPSPTTDPNSTHIACGPPQTWLPYLVQEGETVDGLAHAYQISAAELRNANCLSETIPIFRGMVIFLPDRATITPFLTPTATASTAVPVASITGIGSLGASATPATPLPISSSTVTVTPVPSNTPKVSATDSPAVFSNLQFPPLLLLSCSGYFSVDVNDANGVDYVAVKYSLGDNFYSPAYFADLGNTTETTWAAIVDFNNPKMLTPVYFVFTAYDDLGNVSYSRENTVVIGVTFPCDGSTSATLTPTPRP